VSPGLRIAGAVAARTIRKTLRRPVVLSFSFGQPLLWMLFFGFLFRRVVTELPEGIDYPTFLAPGIAAMTVLFGASQSGIAFIRDLHTGFLPRMLQAAAGRAPVLAGKVGADAARLLVQAAVVLLLSIAVGARLTFAPLPLASALAGLFLFALAFASLSSLIACRTRSQEAMAVFVHLVNMPIFFTSTALIPGKEMPGWLESVASVNPLTLVVEGLRDALLWREPPPIEGTLVLAGIAAILFLLAVSALGAVARD